MTKQEFLRILRGKITGAMDQSEVESQIAYYSGYIDDQMASGKTEEEAVEELGDPLIIAKTLGNAVEGGYIDSDYQGGSHAKDYSGGEQTYQDSDPRGRDSRNYWGGGQSSGRESWNSYQSSRTGYDEDTSTAKGKIKNIWNRIKPVAVLVVGLLVVLACIYFFIRACFTVGGCMFFSFGPIIIIILIIGFLFSFFRRR